MIGLRRCGPINMIAFMVKKPRKAVVEFPRAAVLGPLADQIRRIAQTTERVFFSKHALDQMERRGLTDAEVFNALRMGSLVGLPWFEEGLGGRGCKMVFQPRGSRAVGVITVVFDREELFIKTVEWEDRR